MKKKKQQNNSNPKKTGPKPTNPFEIKVHKVKHNVLGKKSAKDVVGNPNQKKQKVGHRIVLDMNRVKNDSAEVSMFTEKISFQIFHSFLSLRVWIRERLLCSENIKTKTNQTC